MTCWCWEDIGTEFNKVPWGKDRNPPFFLFLQSTCTVRILKFPTCLLYHHSVSVALVHFVSGESHIQALYCHLGGGYFTPKCTFLTLAKLGKNPTAIHHLLTNKTCWLPFAMYYKMTKKKKLLVQSDCIVSWRLRPDCWGGLHAPVMCRHIPLQSFVNSSWTNKSLRWLMPGLWQ